MHFVTRKARQCPSPCQLVGFTRAHNASLQPSITQKLSHQCWHSRATYVGQPEIAALIPERELRVIHTHQPK